MLKEASILRKELDSGFKKSSSYNPLFYFTEEYSQYYGQMNTNGRMMTVKRDGLPYEEMGYCPPPNRKLPPVPGQHSNYNTIDRIKNGKNFRPECSG